MSKNRFDKKTIEDIDVKGKKVLLRCDLNVPMKGDKITDDNRIKASIPTIKYLATHGAKVIICSHLGKEDKRLDIEPVCKALSKALHMPIKFIGSDKVVDDSVVKAVYELKDGQIAMLQNTRWRAEETKNDDGFSKELASLADVFVYDAFGTCHRAHSSTAGVTKFIPVSVAGYLIKAELDKLCNYIDNPVRPFVTILGGSKIADKLKVIDKALDRSDVVIIGGGMAYTFLKGMGYEIGKSLFDESQVSYCMEMVDKAKALKKELVLPVDAVAATNIPDPIDDKKIATKTFSIDKFDKNYMGLDIGPETIKLILKHMINAKTILWNGPVGLFENEKFALGTYSIAKQMSMLKNVKTIIGGGDSAAAVNQFKLANKMTHISTGGGATLEFLKGEPLPGIESLTDK
ncbi:MAG: phosphoglycerate kinase [Lachnospiraceae bacterium]|nr:phosphoglycerate kinase [Lachnospiraceae bacterium]